MKIVATLPPMHPGEMLREEFLKPMALTPYRVARRAECHARGSSALSARNSGLQLTRR